MERSELVRYVVSLAFLMHGLGMTGGVYFVFANRSWLLSAIGGGRATMLIIGLLWVISGIAFIGSAWGFFQGAEWWRAWAAVAAPTSLAGIILWAGAVPPGTYVGAALDLAVIVYLLALR